MTAFDFLQLHYEDVAAAVLLALFIWFIKD